MDRKDEVLENWDRTVSSDLEKFFDADNSLTDSTSLDPEEEEDLDNDGVPTSVSEVLTAKGLTTQQQENFLRGYWMTSIDTAVPISDIPDKQLLMLINAHNEATDGKPPAKYYELKITAMQRGLIE